MTMACNPQHRVSLVAVFSPLKWSELRGSARGCNVTPQKRNVGNLPCIMRIAKHTIAASLERFMNRKESCSSTQMSTHIGAGN